MVNAFESDVWISKMRERCPFSWRLKGLTCRRRYTIEFFQLFNMGHGCLLRLEAVESSLEVPELFPGRVARGPSYAVRAPSELRSSLEACIFAAYSKRTDGKGKRHQIRYTYT